jgi:hypothetical protein
LELRNGRFPIIPEFDLHTLKDTYLDIEDSPAATQSRKTEKKKRVAKKLNKTLNGWESFKIEKLIDDVKLQKYFADMTI